MPVLRGRPPDVMGYVEELAEKLARAEAEIHQPVNAKYSQINVARTQHSDPTFNVAKKHLEGIAEMRTELERVRPQIQRYELAKTTLTEQRRRIIVLRYEEFIAPAEVMEIMELPKTTYYREWRAAMEKILNVLWFRAESGTEVG